MSIQLKNNAYGFLASDISDIDTALTLQSGQGAAFPVLSSGNYFYATLASPAGAIEIVKVIDRSGDLLTCVRAQEGTVAMAFPALSRVEMRVTAQAIYDAVSAASYGETILSSNNTWTGIQTFQKFTIEHGADIASATIIDFTAATGNMVRITGTTPTAGVTLNPGQRMVCFAVDAWPLVHHPINLPLPGGANYTCAPGDVVIISKDGGGVIHVEITKADGNPVSNANLLSSNNTWTGTQTFQKPTIEHGADIASAATIDFTEATGNMVRVTGTTATAGVTLNPGQRMVCFAVDAWPLVHHATNLPLPGGGNYTCTPGDVVVISKDGSGVIHVEIIKADGNPISNVNLLSSDNVWTGKQTFRDNKFEITDDSDTTKKLVFECSNIPANTTKIIDVASYNENIPASDNVWTGTQTFRDNKFEITDAVDTSKKLVFECGSVPTGTTQIIDVATVSQAVAEAGVDTTPRIWTAERVKQAIIALGGGEGLFYKVDPTTVVFTKTGNGTAEIKAGTKVWRRDGTIQVFNTATAITMPTLTAGTDYAIYVCNDGSLRADSDFTAPTGYTTADSRKIGGFHYAPGSNAAAQAGGDNTPQINEFSFWDLHFRPACPDPRGMTLVADSFWADIYLLGVDHITNGTSKYNVVIADDTNPPKIPIKFGGNGNDYYGGLTWWNACEVLRSHGKRPPTYDEFAALAFGTTEETASGGTDVPTTGVDGTGATNTWYTFTSRWGVVQSTGCMMIFGANFGGGAAGAGWVANTGGRGSTYQMENIILLGGDWSSGVNAGSRCSKWDASPTSAGNNITVRGICGHLIVE